MERYGTDKPDLRAGMEIRDLTATGRAAESEVLRKALGEEASLKGFVVEGAGSLSRGRLDKLDGKVRGLGGPGLFWMKKAEGMKASFKIAEAGANSLWHASAARDEDLLLMLAGKETPTLKVLGEVRKDFVIEKLRGRKIFSFAWITDFPLFEWSDEEKKLVSVHHPFTSPNEEDLGFLDSDPARVRAKSYDIVLNGYEIGGGSIRIHDLNLQRKVFKAIGLTPEEAEKKFGFFLEALGYGTPPHGGIAMGFDRIVMLLASEESLREVIPFPKTTSALCLLTSSPSTIDEKQLDELGIKIKNA